MLAGTTYACTPHRALEFCPKATGRVGLQCTCTLPVGHYVYEISTEHPLFTGNQFVFHWLSVHLHQQNDLYYTIQPPHGLEKKIFAADLNEETPRIRTEQAKVSPKTKLYESCKDIIIKQLSSPAS